MATHAIAIKVAEICVHYGLWKFIYVPLTRVNPGKTTQLSGDGFPRKQQSDESARGHKGIKNILLVGINRLSTRFWEQKPGFEFWFP